MKIQVSPGKMKNISNELLNYSEDVKKYVLQLERIVDSINSIWEGDDSLKYINTMKEKNINSLQELNKCIVDYGRYLGDVHETYQMVYNGYKERKIYKGEK